MTKSTQLPLGADLETTNEDPMESFRSRITEVLEVYPLRESARQTIEDVVQRSRLLEQLFLLPDVHRAIEQGDSERLSLLCQGVWLDGSNGMAIDESGELQVLVTDQSVDLRGKVVDEKPMLHRQAIMRQIERWSVFKTNRVLDFPKAAPKVLDIGMGSGIGSVMVRDQYPQADITGLEPGLISDKTREIAEVKRIRVLDGGVDDLDDDGTFDLVLAHFVLEHSRDQAKAILAQSMARLRPGGLLSIAVPNFDSFHREFETMIGLNKRDQESRLSFHDSLSGHQIIFTMQALLGLIKDLMAQLDLDLPIQSCTILPRPFAFNTMCAMGRHKDLLSLMQSAPIPGMGDKGSVICILVGEGIQQNSLSDVTGNTQTLFTDILDQFFEDVERRRQYAKKSQQFLEENYSELH